MLFVRYFAKLRYSRTAHRWQYNKTQPLCTVRMLNNYGYKQTLRIKNAYGFSTTTIVTRTHTNVTLYVHCLCCCCCCCYIAGNVSLHWSYCGIQSFPVTVFSNNGTWMLTSEDGIRNFLSSAHYRMIRYCETITLYKTGCHLLL